MVHEALQLADRLETEVLLSGENDALSAIMTIHPGAGGTESQDWAEMLLRMYLRWAERQGFEASVNDLQPGEEAQPQGTRGVEAAPVQGKSILEEGSRRRRLDRRKRLLGARAAVVGPRGCGLRPGG